MWHTNTLVLIHGHWPTTVNVNNYVFCQMSVVNHDWTPWIAINPTRYHHQRYEVLLFHIYSHKPVLSHDWMQGNVVHHVKPIRSLVLNYYCTIRIPSKKTANSKGRKWLAVSNDRITVTLLYDNYLEKSQRQLTHHDQTFVWYAGLK